MTAFRVGKPATCCPHCGSMNWQRERHIVTPDWLCGTCYTEHIPPRESYFGPGAASKTGCLADAGDGARHLGEWPGIVSGTVMRCDKAIFAVFSYTDDCRVVEFMRHAERWAARVARDAAMPNASIKRVPDRREVLITWGFQLFAPDGAGKAIDLALL